jgi:hypothetical protein
MACFWGNNLLAFFKVSVRIMALFAYIAVQELNRFSSLNYPNIEILNGNKEIRTSGCSTSGQQDTS